MREGRKEERKGGRAEGRDTSSSSSLTPPSIPRQRSLLCTTTLQKEQAMSRPPISQASHTSLWGPFQGTSKRLCSSARRAANGRRLGNGSAGSRLQAAEGPEGALGGRVRREAHELLKRAEKEVICEACR